MNNTDAFNHRGDVIWNIANLLRGPYRPPQYRRVMIPLTVLRRLDCVLEKTKGDVIALHKKLKAEKKDTETIEKIITHKIKVPFFNISEFTFETLLDDPDKLAANLRNYIAGFSSRARKIIEKFNFDEEIDKLEEANRLFEVVKQVAAVDLHPDKIPNIAMGYVFEDLVRRFNEQANEEAGDHFTPREVIKLMVTLLFTFVELAISRKRKDKTKIIAEELTGKAAQTAILKVLDDMKPLFNTGQLTKDRALFDKQLADAFAEADISLDAALRSALLAPESLGERDPHAEICRGKNGNPEADPELRDTENVPFPAGMTLPLPLDYEGKKNKGKVDVAALLDLVHDDCEAYLKAEVLPYRPDAWIDHSKIKVGYEIPFNRQFYEYETPRPLEEIEKDIDGLEEEIMALLKEVTA
jgi:hypothetical protein